MISCVHDYHETDRSLSNMKFIEATGQQLDEIISEGELHLPDMAAAGVKPDTIVRINQHGDIEVRRADRWDVVGGLLGDFEDRLRAVTGLDWL